MDYRNLNIETWGELDTTGDLVTGYKSCYLSNNDNEKSILHIFIDETNNYHFAIKATDVNKNDINDPRLNDHWI